MNKKVILSSILSIILCLSLITGATFALFTSESKTNIAITSGNVEVKATIENLEMYSLNHIDRDTFEAAEEIDRTADQSFLLGGTATIEDGNLTLTNIMPGDRVEFDIKIENNSNVAIKYRTLIAIENDTGLSAGLETEFDKAFGKWETLDSNGATVHGKIGLPASAGDTYKNTTATIVIKVEAVQGNAITADSIIDQNDMNDAINKATTAPTVLDLAAGTYSLRGGRSDNSTYLVNKNITFRGDKDTVMDLTGIVGATLHTQDTGATITFDGVTVKWGEDNEGYQGFANAEKVVYKNCIIYGTQFMGGDAEFIDCIFEASNTAEKGYAVYGRGAGTLTFTNCIFNTDGRAVMLFQDQTTEVNVIMDNCTFIDNGNYTSKNKAVVETGDGEHKTSKFDITIKDCTAYGFEPNGNLNEMSSAFWGNKDSIPADRLTVKMEGTNTHEAGKFVGIYNKESLYQFAKEVNENKKTFAGQTVLLLADIDLGNQEWTPIGQTGATQFMGVFDGNGHTITNLKIDSSAQTGGNYSSGLFGWIEDHGTGIVIKNVNIKNASVTGHHNVGAVVGRFGGGLLENCHVVNATVICTHANDDACGDKAGAVAGWVGDGAVVNSCSAKNSSVMGGRDAGQCFGFSSSIPNFCEADNVTVSATDDCNGTNINQAVVGRVGYAIVGSNATADEINNTIADKDNTTTLVQDIVATDTIEVAAGKNVTFEASKVQPNGQHDVSVNIAENANVTINAGTYMSAGGMLQIFNAQNANTLLVINDGNYEGGVAVWVNSNAKVVINDGTFNTWALAYTDSDFSNNVVEVYGGTFTLGNGGIAGNSRANIIIKGGTFNVDPTEFVDLNTYDVVEDNGMYTVIAK